MHASQMVAGKRSRRAAKTTKEETRCPIAPNVLAKPRDAQSVMASLVSSDIIRGEPRFALASASIASEHAGRVTAIGWAGSRSPSTSRPKTARGCHDAPDLSTRRTVFEDGADFAPHRQNHDRPGDCRSA